MQTPSQPQQTMVYKIRSVQLARALERLLTIKGASYQTKIVKTRRHGVQYVVTVFNGY
jgi:hypothetical protein